MTTQYTQGTTTINTVLPSLFNEVEKPDISKCSQQNTKTWSGLGTTVAIMFGSAIFLLGEGEISNVPELRAQDTSASLELKFGEKIESGVTQEFAHTQQQLPPFPFYHEEDILNLDAVIFTPPPRLSRMIRVKLTYEEPSEPIPVEDPWE